MVTRWRAPSAPWKRRRDAAGTVGALELAEAGERLETAARAGDWIALLPLATDVATAGERLRLYMAERWPG